MNYKKWTLQEEKLVIERRQNGDHIKDIANDIGRPMSAVQRKLERITGQKPRVRKFKWTQGKIESLIKLMNKGYTTSQAAEKLGTTKNAVCGKLNRLRVTTDIKPIQRVRVKKALPPRIYAKKAGGVRYEDLTPKKCHYPLGKKTEKPIEFCGSRRVAGKPYCKGHCAIAYARKK